MPTLLPIMSTLTRNNWFSFFLRGCPRRQRTARYTRSFAQVGINIEIGLRLEHDPERLNFPASTAAGLPGSCITKDTTLAT